MQNLEHKAITSAVNTTDEDGVVEALVSVTGVKDNVGDIIEPGAYSRTLKQRKPKGAWAHEWQTPVSKVKEIKELLPGDPQLPKKFHDGRPWPKEAGALYVKAQFNLNTQAGKDAYENVKFFDDECEWSIGYKVPRGGATKDTKTGIRNIKDLDLFEFSPVLFGAASEARSLSSSIKALQFDFNVDDEEEEAEAKGATDETIDENGEIVERDKEEDFEEDKDISDDELIAILMETEDDPVEDSSQEKSEARTKPRTVEASAVIVDQLKRLQNEINTLLGVVLDAEKKDDESEEIESKTIGEAIDDITKSDADFQKSFYFDIIKYTQSAEDEKKDSANALLDSISAELDRADEKSERLLKVLAKSIGDSYGTQAVLEEEHGESEGSDSHGQADNSEKALNESGSSSEALNGEVAEGKVTLSAEEYKALFGLDLK